MPYGHFPTGCVFNGSTLGKAYSAKGIMERCNEKVLTKGAVGKQSHRTAKPDRSFGHGEGNDAFAREVQKFIEVLTAPEFSTGYIPRELKVKKKKRRKGN